MGKRARNKRRRSEITDSVEKSQHEMKEKGNDLERETHDIEITRETLDAIEGGTEEGANEVTEAIERAEEVTERIFEGDSEQLDQIHAEGQETERAAQESSDAAERDTERIDDASASIDTRENLGQLKEARESAVRDREFLDRHIENLDRVIDESEEDYRQLHSRVQSKKRS
jgi:chromosome segregation ATPase